jgi:hypothetical protein
MYNSEISKLNEFDRLDRRLTFKCGYFNINKEASTNFFVLRDDIEDQEVEIKVFYDLNMPENIPINEGYSLSLEISKENEEIVYTDDSLPISQGENKFIWQGENFSDNLDLIKENPGAYYAVFSLFKNSKIIAIEKFNFYLIKIELYVQDQINGKFNKEYLLKDWKDEQKKHHPSWLFGQTNFIYPKIIVPDDMVITPEGLQVISESSGINNPINFNLIKKSINGQKYYITLKDLALSSKNITYDSYKTIKVVDEEFLTFSLKLKSLNDYSGKYYDVYRVMVDRAEYGLSWQDYKDRPAPVPEAESLIHEISKNINLKPPAAPGAYTGIFRWNLNFDFSNIPKNSNYPSLIKHFHKDTDTTFADSVDMVFRFGHGGIDQSTNESNILFDTDNGIFDSLYHNDCSFGETDVEFVILCSCNFLKGKNEIINNKIPIDKNIVTDELSKMMNGAHVICGFKTVSQAHPNILRRFIDAVRNGKSVCKAWAIAVVETQESGTIGRSLYLKDCFHESIYLLPDKSEYMPLKLKENIKKEYKIMESFGSLPKPRK